MINSKASSYILFIYWILSAFVKCSLQSDALFYGPGRESPGTDNEINDNAQFFTNNDPEILEESGSGLTLTSDYPCPTKCVCFARKFAHCSRTNLTNFPADIHINNNSKKITNSAQFQAVFPRLINGLYLGFNEISYLKDKCLIESGKNLTVLSLTHNQIYKIFGLAFEGLGNLQQLDLSYNLIRSVTHTNKAVSRRAMSVFSPLRGSLISLYLSHNVIRGIPFESFTNLINLEVLTLSHNEIAWISKNAFRNLEKLRILHLRENQLSRNSLGRLPEIFSSFYTQTSTLNRIESLCLTSSFEDFNRIEPLSYNENYNAENLTPPKVGPLKTLDLGRLNLHRVPRKLPTSLQILFLDGNFIHIIRSRDFKGMVLLETLHLSSNELRTIELGSFDSLYQLRRLDLSKNQLSRLHPNTFCGLITLSNLRMYQNPRLTNLPKKIFASNRSLKILYLQDCRIRTLPSGPWIYRLSALWLYGNPIDCQCRNIVPILMKLRDTSTTPFSMDTFRLHVWDGGDTWLDQRQTDTTCSTPSRYRGYPVKEILMRDLYCTVTDIYNITINKQLANGYGYYQNDQPSDLQEADYNDYNNMENSLKILDHEYDGYLEKFPRKQYDGIEFLNDLPSIPESTKEPIELLPDLLYPEELGSAKQDYELNLNPSDIENSDLSIPLLPDKDFFSISKLDEPEYNDQELFSDQYQPDYSYYNDTKLDSNEETRKQIVPPQIYNDSNNIEISNQTNITPNSNRPSTREFLNEYADETSNIPNNTPIESNSTRVDETEANMFTTKQLGETWLFEIPRQAQFYEDETDNKLTPSVQNNNNVIKNINMTSRRQDLMNLNTDAPKRNIFPPKLKLDHDSNSITPLLNNTSQNDTMTSHANNPTLVNDEDAGFLVEEYEYPDSLRRGPSEYEPDPDYENSGELPSFERDVLTPDEYQTFKRKLARVDMNEMYDSYYFDNAFYLEDER